VVRVVLRPRMSGQEMEVVVVVGKHEVAAVADDQ